MTFLSLTLVPAPVPVRALPIKAQAREQTDAQSISNIILTNAQREHEERMGALVPPLGIIVHPRGRRGWKPQDHTDVENPMLDTMALPSS